MRKIAIFGVPRSGTSWLSQIFNSHPDVALRFQPLFSYTHKGRLSDHSTHQEIEQFFDDISKSDDSFALMKAEMHKGYPTFVKAVNPTHIVFKEMRYLHIIENLLNQCPDIKVVAIARNPLATLASWVKAPKEFNPQCNVYEEWRFAPSKNQGKPEEFYGFNKWKEATQNFLKLQELYPLQFLLVRYDHLIANPDDVTATIFKFCGLDMQLQVKEFIISSRSVHDADPYSVFRAKANDNDWLKDLPTEIVDEIVLELKNTPLNTFLGCVNHA